MDKTQFLHDDLVKLRLKPTLKSESNFSQRCVLLYLSILGLFGSSIVVDSADIKN